MRRTPPYMQDLAQRLIACETKENKSAETKSPGVFFAVERLRPYLTELMGNAGFDALLSRALVLAKAESPGLQAVYIRRGGALEMLDDIALRIDSEKNYALRVAVLAQLLALLATFIGEDLTRRLVHDVWPKLPLDDVDLGEGDKK